MGREKIKNPRYTGSLLYEIELTAKYCKMLGTQVFEKINSEVSIEEFTVLDTILENPDICQRDIAKLILKDRANTGKLLDNLERKGFIQRKLTIKNNRPIKSAQLTERGNAILIEISKKLKPHTSFVKEKIQKHDLEKISIMLKELRAVLKESLEIQI